MASAEALGHLALQVRDTDASVRKAASEAPQRGLLARDPLVEQAPDAGDVLRALRVIANDAVFWFSNGTTQVGKEAIADAIRERLGQTREARFEISSVRWIVRTVSTAVSVYRFRWSGTKDGRPARGSGRGTAVFGRREGRWLLVHEHRSRGDWTVPLPRERRPASTEPSAWRASSASTVTSSIGAILDSRLRIAAHTAWCFGW